MSVFGEGTSDPLEQRVALLEQRLATLDAALSAQGSAYGSALDAEALARGTGDDALDAAIDAERTARAAGDQAMADLIGDLILRVAALEIGGGGGGGGGSYVPSLTFSDPRNSGYLTFTILEDF